VLRDGPQKGGRLAHLADPTRRSAEVRDLLEGEAIWQHVSIVEQGAAAERPAGMNAIYSALLVAEVRSPDNSKRALSRGCT
jgi:hypothetical protein